MLKFRGAIDFDGSFLFLCISAISGRPIPCAVMAVSMYRFQLYVQDRKNMVHTLTRENKMSWVMWKSLNLIGLFFVFVCAFFAVHFFQKLVMNCCSLVLSWLLINNGYSSIEYFEYRTRNIYNR